MALVKVNYVDGTTVITAKNLNDIQDSIIDLEANRTVPTNVRGAILTLLENAAYATTGLEDEIAIIESWAEEIVSITLSDSELTLNGSTPNLITATTVPSGATVTWESSDTSIAMVTDGLVTGVSNGTCIITASAGDMSATCYVTVEGFVELESISAVYTQSGTVYDIDDIDSLKDDLVVTATYSDSTTETIPSTDYTLSGTLTVGTSTIYVVYGDKTTTFNVSVTAYYTTLSYIESDGAVYIDTNHSHTVNTKVVLDYMSLKQSGTSFQCPVGSSGVDSSADKNPFHFYIGSSLTVNGSMGRNTPTSTMNSTNFATTDPRLSSVTISYGERHIYTMDSKNKHFSIDNTQYDVESGVVSSWDNPSLALFARKHPTLLNAYAVGRMYSVKIYENDVLIADYTPRKRNTDNEYGLYDSISGNFLTGIGSGSLIGA